MIMKQENSEIGKKVLTDGLDQDKYCIRHYDSDYDSDYDKKIRYKYGPLVRS